MWLGVSEAGRFAVVTNLTGFGAPELALRSRGALVRDWLEAGVLDADRLMDFNPFNLFVATPEGAHLGTSINRMICCGAGVVRDRGA
jgi:uncharacterized protein with NRDE domain